MDRYLARISTLLVEPSDGTPAVCKVFSAKPTIERELLVGKLFGLAKISPAGTVAEEFVNELIEEVKNGLYAANGKKRSFGGPTAAGLDEIFSSVLQQANSVVARFFEFAHSGIDLGQSSILLGNIRQQQLTIVTVGNITGFLIHYRASRDYQTVTITEPNPTATVNPIRLFTQTISGTVGPLDYLFFCTENVLDYLSQHTIQSTIPGSSGADSIRQLKHALMRAKPKTTAAAVIVNLVLQRPAATAPPNLQSFSYTATAAKDSMKVLDQTQHKTNRLLSPHLMPDRKNFFNWIGETRRRFLERAKRFTLKSTKTLPEKPPDEAATPVVPPRPAAWRSSAVAPQRLYRSFIQPLNRIIQSPRTKNIFGAITAALHKVWRSYRQLPAKRQLIILGCVVVAILLGYNLTSLSARRAKNAREKAFATVLTQVELLRNAADEATVYQNENGARQRLNEALQAIQQLPEPYADHPTVVRDRRELTARLNELRHETVITDPLQLANFKNLDDQAKSPPVLVRINDRLYTQNTKTKNLLMLNLTSRTIAAVQPPNVPIASLTTGVGVKTTALLLDADSRVLLLETGDRLRPIPLTLPNGKITSITVFRDRLYLLSAPSGSIFRSDAIGGGYGNPRPWLTDPSADLRTAVDIAVDGDVYVLRSDGIVLKLNQGKLADFSLNAIDPMLAGPTKIKTSENSDFLYLLDPPTKRLVVVTKTGALVQQYRADLFDQLKDFIVDESNKTVYLLNGTQIFGIAMKHL